MSNPRKYWVFMLNAEKTGTIAHMKTRKNENLKMVTDDS